MGYGIVNLPPEIGREIEIHTVTENVNKHSVSCCYMD